MSSTTADEATSLFAHRYQPARTARGEARRAQILAAAVALFREHGFHGTSMDQIGAAAGVSGPALYYHYRSKQEILGAVFFYIGDESFDQLRDSIDTDTDPHGQLESVVTGYVDTVIAHRDVVPLLYEEVRNLAPEDERRSTNRRRLLVEYIAYAIARVRADLMPSETRQLAASIIWMVYGIGFTEPALGDDDLKPFLVNVALAAVMGARSRCAADTAMTSMRIDGEPR